MAPRRAWLGSMGPTTRNSATRRSRAVSSQSKSRRATLEALKPSKLEFDLGLKQSATLPSYFARDFPEPVFGSCEPSGYRADFFLLASHVSKAQSDPNNYAFYTVPVRDLHAYAAGPPK